MPIKKIPFTFLTDFAIIPMDSGSFMLEQGLNFSRAFTSLTEVVLFLIEEKDKYVNNIPTTSAGLPSEYEYYDRTGTPGYGKEDDE